MCGDRADSCRVCVGRPSISPPPFAVPPTPMGGTITLTKGVEENFSLGYIRTAAVLVLPLCGGTPLAHGGDRCFMTVPPSA